MEKKLQDMNIKYAQLQSQQHGDDTGHSRLNDRLATAITKEKLAKAEVVKLEAVVAAYESRVRILLYSQCCQLFHVFSSLSLYITL